MEADGTVSAAAHDPMRSAGHQRTDGCGATSVPHQPCRSGACVRAAQLNSAIAKADQQATTRGCRHANECNRIGSIVPDQILHCQWHTNIDTKPWRARVRAARQQSGWRRRKPTVVFEVMQSEIYPPEAAVQDADDGAAAAAAAMLTAALGAHRAVAPGDHHRRGCNADSDAREGTPPQSATAHRA